MTHFQSLYRGHYARLMLSKKAGIVEWQTAVINTMELLRKTGVTQDEASAAATRIQVKFSLINF